MGGQLSVAPEHVSPRVLEKMKKPGIESFERFQAMFACASEEAGKEQYDIPYFISGHPGCTLEDMVDLALWLKRTASDRARCRTSSRRRCRWPRPALHRHRPLQPEAGPRHPGLREKRLQKALLFYWNPDSWPEAREALIEAGRQDLIGRGARVPRAAREPFRAHPSALHRPLT